MELKPKFANKKASQFAQNWMTAKIDTLKNDHFYSNRLYVSCNNPSSTSPTHITSYRLTCHDVSCS